MDHKYVGVMDFANLAQGREKWKAFVNTMTNMMVL
jgi:hypothetical protein